MKCEISWKKNEFCEIKVNRQMFYNEAQLVVTPANASSYILYTFKMWVMTTGTNFSEETH